MFINNLKSTIEKLIKAIGYEINKISDKEEVNKIPDKEEIDLYYRIYGKETVENRRFYNIGAGSFRHPAWTNVDHESDWYSEAQGNRVGIDWDLLSLAPIPVEEYSAEIVYSSHTIEHITDEAAQNMFNETYRILKKNGVFRVTTPNIDLDFRAYKRNDKHYYYWINWYSSPKNYRRVKLNKPFNQASIHQIFLHHFASNASTLYIGGSQEKISNETLDRCFQEMEYEEVLNYCISKCSLDEQKRIPGNHINWWNQSKLLRMLKIAGFGNVYLSAYGQSSSPVLRNTLTFDNTHPKVSLYVEAIK